MRTLGCKTIKDGITTAIIFLITGISLLITGWLMPDLWYLPHIIIISACLVLFMIPLILLGTYLKNRTSSQI